MSRSEKWKETRSSKQRKVMCFDCGKKKKRNAVLPAIRTVDRRTLFVCDECWFENWERWCPIPGMPHDHDL